MMGITGLVEGMLVEGMLVEDGADGADDRIDKSVSKIDGKKYNWGEIQKEEYYYDEWGRMEIKRHKNITNYNTTKMDNWSRESFNKMVKLTAKDKAVDGVGTRLEPFYNRNMVSILK